MTIETPREGMDNRTNKCFHSETIVNAASYGVSDRMGEPELGTNFEIPVGPATYTGEWFEHTFKNPTNENPMRASEFLSRLNLTPVLDVVKERYGNKKWHYRYPVEAMIKALAFKHIKGIKHDTDLVKYLKEHPEEARLLGFNGKIPSQQTFSHFITARMRNEGLYDLFDGLVVSIKNELENLGHEFGKVISIDSTPLRSLLKDPDAKYNPHYKIKGYKVHNAIDAEYYLPVAFNFTDAWEGDSPHYLPLLDRIQMLGIKFEKVLADGAYASFENFAVVNQHYKARTVFNLRENAKIQEDGTPKGIKKEYNKLWKEEGYNPDAGPDYMLAYLMWQDKEKVVGAYYWNIHLREWEDSPDETKEEYNKRGGVEAFHGHVKERMSLEKNLNRKGLRNAELHVLLCYISLLCVALCRVQNGVTTGLANVKCLV